MKTVVDQSKQRLLLEIDGRQGAAAPPVYKRRTEKPIETRTTPRLTVPRPARKGSAPPSGCWLSLT